VSGPTGEPAPSNRFPPVAELAVLSVALMLSGGIYLAAHLPRHPPLGPAVGLLVAGGVFSVASVALLVRIRPFAWDSFFLVARWALLAYAVIAGILGFVFIYDHTRGSTLAVLILTLVVFALDVPMIIAFTVARYAKPPDRA
jgi:drug/metabolite transporter (DMT)-like permease